MYQLQINPRKIADDSGNTNPKRIRHNFVIEATPPLPVRTKVATSAPAKPDAPADLSLARATEELFGSTAILA